MMYDVVFIRESESYNLSRAVEKLSERVNYICNNGHKGKKGWKPQGGISVTFNSYWAFASQAIVNDEYDESTERLF